MTASTTATVQYRCAQPQRARGRARRRRTLNGIDFLEVARGPGHARRPLPAAVLGAGAVPAARPDQDERAHRGRRARVPASRCSTPADADARRADRHRRPVRATSRTYVPAARRPGRDRDQPRPASTRGCPSVDVLVQGRLPERLRLRARSMTCPPDGPGRAGPRLPGQGLRQLPRLMLDRLASTLPGWTERNAADQQVDARRAAGLRRRPAVATSRTRSPPRRTWRRRAGACRCAATPACSTTGCTTAATPAPSCTSTSNRGSSLEAGRRGAGRTGRRRRRLPDAARRSTCCEAHNEIPLYTWSDDLCCLPAGATRRHAERHGRPGAGAGDFLLLEETAGPTTGLSADADPAHRQVVRLTECRRPTSIRSPGPACSKCAWVDPRRADLPALRDQHRHARRRPPARRSAPSRAATSRSPTTGWHGDALLPLADDPTDSPGPLAAPTARRSPLTQAVALRRRTHPRPRCSPSTRARRCRSSRLDDGELELGAAAPATCSTRPPTDPGSSSRSRTTARRALRFGDDVSGMAADASARSSTPPTATGNGTAGNVAAGGARLGCASRRARGRRSATRCRPRAAWTPSRPSRCAGSPPRPSGCSSGR